MTDAFAFCRRGRVLVSIQSPYVSIANRQAEIMMRISAEFGFTPASRGRISVAAEPEKTLFDEIDRANED